MSHTLIQISDFNPQVSHQLKSQDLPVTNREWVEEIWCYDF
jgi:hypothetical protein